MAFAGPTGNRKKIEQKLTKATKRKMRRSRLSMPNSAFSAPLRAMAFNGTMKPNARGKKLSRREEECAEEHKDKSALR